MTRGRRIQDHGEHGVAITHEEAGVRVDRFVVVGEAGVVAGPDPAEGKIHVPRERGPFPGAV